MLTSQNIEAALRKLKAFRQEQKEYLAASIVNYFQTDVEDQPRKKAARAIAELHDQSDVLRNLNDIITDLMADN